MKLWVVRVERPEILHDGPLDLVESLPSVGAWYQAVHVSTPNLQSLRGSRPNVPCGVSGNRDRDDGGSGRVCRERDDLVPEFWMSVPVETATVWVPAGTPVAVAEIHSMRSHLRRWARG